MSGRKQHYIPQFLLRGFAEAGAGKSLQVRVVTPDRTFVCGTSGIAAQREFYSKLEEGTAGLDHVVTEAEKEYAAIYRSLAATPGGQLAPAEEVARLLTHLAVRALHTRDTVSLGGQYAAKRVSDLLKDPAYLKARLGISRGELSLELRSKLDEFYNERKPSFRKVGMSRHEFRRYAAQRFADQWDKIADQLTNDVDDLMSLLHLSQMVVASHRKVLSDTLEPAERVDVLKAFEWEAIHFDQKVLALPDCIAIAHENEVGACPFGFVANEALSGIIFPLSPVLALCAGSYRRPQVLNTLVPRFGTYAAMCSLRFLVMPPSAPFDTSAADRIGDAVAQLIVNSVEKSVAESLSAAFLP